MGTSWKKWKSVLDVGARLITLSCFMCIPLQCYLCWGKLLSENTETTIYLKQTSPKLSISLCLVPDFQVFIETPDTIVPLNEADLGVDYINDFSSTWKPFFRTNNSKIKSYLYSKDKMIYMCKKLDIFEVSPKMIRIRTKYGKNKGSNMDELTVGGMNGKNLIVFLHEKGMSMSKNVIMIPDEALSSGNYHFQLDANIFETASTRSMECKDYLNEDYDDCRENIIIQSINTSLGCALPLQWLFQYTGPIS